jgi:hypothetical protein
MAAPGHKLQKCGMLEAKQLFFTEQEWCGIAIGNSLATERQ